VDPDAVQARVRVVTPVAPYFDSDFFQSFRRVARWWRRCGRRRRRFRRAITARMDDPGPPPADWNGKSSQSTKQTGNGGV